MSIRRHVPQRQRRAAAAERGIGAKSSAPPPPPPPRRSEVRSTAGGGTHIRMKSLSISQIYNKYYLESITIIGLRVNPNSRQYPSCVRGEGGINAKLFEAAPWRSEAQQGACVRVCVRAGVNSSQERDTGGACACA